MIRMSLRRRVEPELLDSLPAEDPRAQRSRNDLRRIHRAMATSSIAQRALDRGMAGFRPSTILELGAGDGSLMLRLAQRRASGQRAARRRAGRSINEPSPPKFEDGAQPESSHAAIQARCAIGRDDRRCESYQIIRDRWARGSSARRLSSGYQLAGSCVSAFARRITPPLSWRRGSGDVTSTAPGLALSWILTCK